MTQIRVLVSDMHVTPEHVLAYREYLKAQRLLVSRTVKLEGYDVPDDMPHRAPEDLAGAQVAHKQELTHLQRQTIEDRLTHLEELLRFTKLNPKHPKSLGYTERDREAAIARLEQEIAKTRTRLEAS